MRKFAIGIALVMFITAGLWVVDVGATGLGVYASYADGSFDGETDSGRTYEYDFSLNGIGFVLDTAVARNNVFNYRLNFGYEKRKDSEVDRAAIYNTFGFGVLRNETVRLWLGPQIGLAYGGWDSDFQHFELGVAPVVGVNFHFPKVSFCLDLGYRLSYYNYGSDNSSDGDGTRKQFFLNASVLFRMGDDF